MDAAGICISNAIYYLCCNLFLCLLTIFSLMLNRIDILVPPALAGVVDSRTIPNCTRAEICTLCIVQWTRMADAFQNRYRYSQLSNVAHISQRNDLISYLFGSAKCHLLVCSTLQIHVCFVSKQKNNIQHAYELRATFFIQSYVRLLK